MLTPLASVASEGVTGLPLPVPLSPKMLTENVPADVELVWNRFKAI
jgi:hypothetical protein